ncbi:hypothetical protein HX109_08345 [Galbibacter sp. BG1]|uniref:Ig-like domain-containing protein n=1 Tax=Galbibacter sp. BG1 TaxID=1170699 RepID=UPI0015B9814A|nr:Ig-like domain-containing protein [Galbibacter sp. BG1]QLE01572.1 hypothetical protein HX109_08345 [Galbibacter sp. BG1]
MLRFVTLLIFFAFIIGACSEDKEEVDVTPPNFNIKIEGLDISSSTTETPIIGNKIDIEINSKDEKSISKVEAFINSDKLSEDLQAPFKLSLDLSSYSSVKKNTSNKGDKYSLKVVATGFNGMTAATTQEVFIDNTLPTISEVSIANDTIINGEENIITFIAEDDQEITKLEVVLNDTIIEHESLEDNNYQFNINTLTLEDGIKTFIISASDAAGNKTDYNISLTTDNTGPSMTFENIENGQTIYGKIILEPILEDLYSDIDSIQIKLNDSILVSTKNEKVSFEFDAKQYPTGNHKLNISSTDHKGNKSIKEINFLIHRRLLVVNIPEGLISNSFSQFYIFSSDKNGAILDLKEVFPTTRSVTLSTEKNLGSNDNFMVTFAAFSSGYADSSYLTTFQNLTINNPSEVHLKQTNREISQARKYVNSTGLNFEPTLGSIINVDAYGSDYNGQYINDTNKMWMELYETTLKPTSSKVYFSYHNQNNNNYKYYIVDRDSLKNNFKLNYNNFITDGVERRFFNASISDESRQEYGSSLILDGYLNEEDFLNGSFNRIWSYGNYPEKINGAYFDFNTNFHKYSYRLAIGNYFTKRVGQPKEFYDVPTWTLDYSFSNNQLNLTTTGANHYVGNVYLENDDQSQDIYRWKIIFNSKDSERIILPELPLELATWNIMDDFQNQNLTIQQVDIRRYGSIENYDEYLNKSLKNNLNNSQTSDLIEGIYSNKYPAFSDIEDFFIFRYY